MRIPNFIGLMGAEQGRAGAQATVIGEAFCTKNVDIREACKIRRPAAVANAFIAAFFDSPAVAEG
jgi:hypothetical protein